MRRYSKAGLPLCVSSGVAYEHHRASLGVHSGPEGGRAALVQTTKYSVGS